MQIRNQVCLHQPIILWPVLFVLGLPGLLNAAQQRTLSFPDDDVFATLILYDLPQPSDNITGYVDFDFEGEPAGVAAGDRVIPDEVLVGIKVNGRDKKYQPYLAGLPTEGIHCLELVNATITSSTVRAIERLASLRVLTFVHCKVAEPELIQPNGLPQLQELRSRGSDQPASLHPLIAKWASKCPRLQYVYDGQSMTAEEILRFQDHDVPIFLTVEFGEDATEVIEALSTVKGLAGLNVTVTDKVPPEYCRGLERLSRLELFNWSGNTLDEELLDCFAGMNRLRTLRMYGGSYIADVFIANLPRLRNLESILFNFPLSKRQNELLPNVLLSMKSVRDLPSLNSPTVEQLAALASRSNIEGLSVAGLGKHASTAQLAGVLRSNPGIESLSLSRIPLDREIGEAICECRSLRHLWLSVSKFDGAMLESPQRLTALETLLLEAEFRPENLSALTKLPALTSLTLNLNSVAPQDWSFIADVKTLEELSIDGGFCDDSIVQWIRQNQSIKRFWTYQSVILTDQGVDQLSDCRQLESLSIEGFISSASIERLASLKNLRSLYVGTNLVDAESLDRLQKKFDHLDDFDINKFQMFTKDIVIGSDQLFRQVPHEGRKALDAIAGVSLSEMLGPAHSNDLRDQLEGKVVLAEFWGTWCGPCLIFMPELERLNTRFEKDGLRILTIHSKSESESVDDYLQKHPKPWPNIVDHDERLERRFAVPSYPSTYIFGRDGRLKVALPYRYGLDRAIETLLENP